KTLAEDCLGGTAFAVAFERNAREAAGHKGQIVEGGPGAWPKGAEAANTIEAEFGFDLDVLDNGRSISAAGLRRRRGGEGVGTGLGLSAGVYVHGCKFSQGIAVGVVASIPGQTSTDIPWGARAIPVPPRRGIRIPRRKDTPKSVLRCAVHDRRRSHHRS